MGLMRESAWRLSANRPFALRLLAIAAGALALRILYTVVIDPHQTGIGDFYYYHDLANTIARGYGYVDPGSVLAGHATPTAVHPPLWPELLSIVSRLGGDGAPIGVHGNTGYTAHRLTGAFLGTGTVVAIGYLGRRVGGARVGLIAAAIAAVYPVLVTADGSLLTESLFGLLVAISMVLAYRMLDAPNGWRAVALGVAIGVSWLTRSEGLLLLPLLALPVIWRRDNPVRTVAIRFALATLAAALTIAPWTIRDSVRFHQLVIGSTNSGALIAGANCHGAYHGRDIGLWLLGCVGPPPSPNEAEASNRLRADGIRYARRHLDRVPVVVAVRVLRTWDLFQPWRDVKLNEGRQWTVSRVGLVFYWLLLPLSVLGGVALVARRAPLRVVLAPVVFVTLISVLGYGLPRFRHPAEISIVILAAVGLSRVLDRLRPTPTRSSRGAST
jgi:4-amino-4-deoxy-L-arabinose transferase-like glycosyltransferase